MKITTTIVAILLALAAPAVAQESNNRVATKTDWSVFVERKPTSGNAFSGCWGVSSPKQTVNTRSGQVVQVRRGDIALMVFYGIGSANPQVTFTGGYPFAGGSDVTLEIDGTTFAMGTDGEWAWPRDPSDEPRIVAAMKRGSEAVLSGRSGRGTSTKDTFSLLGFTAAVDEARR